MVWEFKRLLLRYITREDMNSFSGSMENLKRINSTHVALM